MYNSYCRIHLSFETKGHGHIQFKDEVLGFSRFKAKSAVRQLLGKIDQHEATQQLLNLTLLQVSRSEDNK